MVNNPDPLNQFGCHNNTAVFLETSVFGKCALAPHSEKDVSLLCMVLMSFMLIWIWQRCNIFLNSSAGTPVWYKIFPGIYSANCCNARRIVVKSKMAV